MRERPERVRAALIQLRAEKTPDLDVLTFEHLSLDDRATPDEVRSYASLQTNANRLAAGLAAKGVGVGDRFAIMLRNHPEFVEGMIAASILGALLVPIDPPTRGEQPACVEACRTAGNGAMVFGDLNDSSSEVAKLVANTMVHALREDLGLGPNVYYIGL